MWVGAGRSPAQYKQAAKFVSFLLSPEMQVEMVRAYGGLPLTAAARAATHSKVLKDDDKTLEIAYASLKGNGGKPAVRVANIDPVRIIADEELEHAELAWQTVAWAMAAGGVEVTRAVRAVFNQLTVTPEAAERCTPGTVAHGILPVEARNAATAACVGEVLRPVFASLLATRLAA